MNKKELLEIRKTIIPEKNCLTTIKGCYVDGDKAIICKTEEEPYLMPEEDLFKYTDVFKKTLSGSIGKNQLNLNIRNEEEKDNGSQAFLMKLLNSKLKDNDLLEKFYSMIIDSYSYSGNYYIILTYGIYDIPGKATDGSGMYDASEDVYSYILCSICPVDRAKAGLSYNEKKNHIEDRERDWIVGTPMHGFLFPAFNDRATDIHSVLHYTKKTDPLEKIFIENILGCDVPLSYETQKASFESLIVETLDQECDFETVKNINDTIYELIEDNEDLSEDIVLDKNETRKIFEKSGVSKKSLDEFDRKYDKNIGKHNSIMACNIIDKKNIQIGNADVSIKVDAQHTDLISTNVINGHKCIVINISDRIEINGINALTISEN